MKKATTLISCLLLFSCLSLAQNIGNYVRAKITATPAQLQSILAAGVDIDHHLKEDANSFTVEISKADFQKIQLIGAHTEIITADLEHFYRHQNDGILQSRFPDAVPIGFNLGSMGGALTLAEYSTELDSIHQLYPNLTTAKFSIGTSFEGRPIYAIKLSDNPTIDEPEPEVLYSSLIHAREPVAGMQNMYFIYDILQKYSQNDPTARRILNSRELFFVPVINPDGYEYNYQTNPEGGGMWRKNRRPNSDGSYGVDLNRNYGYQWGYDDMGSSADPTSEVYRGTAGFSEPETQAMRNFCNQRNFKTALNYHTFSNLLIRPWAFDEAAFCPDDAIFTENGNLMIAENQYLFGSSTQTVGYQVNGSSDDWMYGAKSIIAMTPEIGNSFWVNLSEIIPLCQEVLSMNYLNAWLAGEYAESEWLTNLPINTLNPSLPIRTRSFTPLNSRTPITVQYIPNSPYINNAPPTQTLLNLSPQTDYNNSFNLALNANTPNNTTINGTLRTSFSGISLDVPANFIYQTAISTNTELALGVKCFYYNSNLHLEVIDVFDGKILIVDALGRTQYQQNVQKSSIIDTHNWAKGIYFYTLYNERGSQKTGKFLID